MLSITRMTDEEYRNLILAISEIITPYGKMLAAEADKGLCYFGFLETYDQALQDLRRRFPYAKFRKQEVPFSVCADNISLFLHATDFQFAVWQALLSIPLGQTTTYKAIAELIGKPKAVRAVGTAIGKNPISVIIPCHRVISSDGSLGGYFWGLEKKKELLKKELLGKNY